MTKKVQLNEIPDSQGYTGLTISTDPVDYTPSLLLESLGIPEKDWPIFKIRPYTVPERHTVEGEEARVRAKMSLWIKEIGLDMQPKKTNKKDDKGKYIYAVDPKNKSAWLNQYDYYTDKVKLSDIIRKCIVGFKLKSNGKVIKFKKDDEGFLHEDVFNTFHPRLITTIGNEIYRMSNPDISDILGL